MIDSARRFIPDLIHGQNFLGDHIRFTVRAKHHVNRIVWPLVFDFIAIIIKCNGIAKTRDEVALTIILVSDGRVDRIAVFVCGLQPYIDGTIFATKAAIRSDVSRFLLV